MVENRNKWKDESTWKIFDQKMYKYMPNITSSKFFWLYEVQLLFRLLLSRLSLYKKNYR